MILLLLASVFYAVLTTMTTSLLNQLTVPLLMIFIYVVPLLFNFGIYKIQKEKWKILTAIITPALSISFYLFFAYFTSVTGSWYEFVRENTVSDANMSLEITQNLFASSQIVFIGVLFYGVSLAYHFVSQKVLNKGVKHA